MWQVATILDSIDVKHFHYHRKFCGTALVLPASTRNGQSKEITEDWSNDGRLPAGSGDGSV